MKPMTIIVECDQIEDEFIQEEFLACSPEHAEQLEAELGEASRHLQFFEVATDEDEADPEVDDVVFVICRSDQGGLVPVYATLDEELADEMRIEKCAEAQCEFEVVQAVVVEPEEDEDE
jgi:hypothetical protein